MITLRQMLDLLNFSESHKQILLALEVDCRNHIDQKMIDALTHKDTWKQAQETIESILIDDEQGMKMLCCMMIAATSTYERYVDKQLPKSIFVDTMNCFPRFVKEYEVAYGCVGFDRFFWTGRQLSLQLFRIQELEFELCKEAQESIIAIHIPSDALLEKEQCVSSIQQAKKFFQTYRLCGNGGSMICESWLLSPALKKLLPDHSHILQFQSLFEIQSWDKEEKEFLMWVYHCEDMEFEKLAEDTTLQRSMKQYLIHGGKIGSAKGRLKLS